MNRREMAVRPGRTEVRHPEMLFDGPRTADEFAVDGLHALVRERSRIGVGDSREHGFLTRGIEGLLILRSLDVADPTGQRRTLVHQAHE